MFQSKHISFKAQFSIDERILGFRLNISGRLKDIKKLLLKHCYVVQGVKIDQDSLRFLNDQNLFLQYFPQHTISKYCFKI
jgi:hypothetical protein